MAECCIFIATHCNIQLEHGAAYLRYNRNLYTTVIAVCSPVFKLYITGGKVPILTATILRQTLRYVTRLQYICSCGNNVMVWIHRSQRCNLSLFLTPSLILILLCRYKKCRNKNCRNSGCRNRNCPITNYHQPTAALLQCLGALSRLSSVVQYNEDQVSSDGGRNDWQLPMGELATHVDSFCLWIRIGDLLMLRYDTTRFAMWNWQASCQFNGA